MVVSLLAVAKHAVNALPEVDPTQPAKLIPLRAAANNLSRCEGHFRALAVHRQIDPDYTLPVDSPSYLGRQIEQSLNPS